MLTVKSVSIENMHNVFRKTYNLNGLTYFHGLNGVGKTTAMQAIQLAILGYIPGTGKTNEAIFRHANGKTLSVTVVLSDGKSESVTVSRTWVKTGSRVTSTVDVQPESYDIKSIIADIELPIFNFSSLMDMSANKLKDWFISHLPNSATEIDWPVRLRSVLDSFENEGPAIIADNSDVLERVLAVANTGIGLEGVRTLNTYLKSEVSAVDRQIRDLEGSLKSMVHYDELDSYTEEDVEELRRKIAELRKERDGVIRYRSAVAANERQLAALTQYQDLSDSIDDHPGYAEASKTLQHLYELKRQTSDEKSKITQEIQDLSSKVHASKKLISSGGICSYTNEVCDSIVKLIDKMEADTKTTESRIRELTAEAFKLDQQFGDYEKQSRSIKQQIADIRQKYQNRDFIRSTISPVDETYANYTLDVIDAQLSQSQDLLEKVIANLKYNQIVEHITLDSYRYKQDLVVLKRWVKFTDANHLQNELTTSPFADLSNEMNEYVHKLYGNATYDVHFDLREKANSFSFGLIRDNVYVPFDLLSSGERCIFTLAMMACLVAKSESPLKIILVDDLLDHLDPTKINKLFTSLKSLKNVQIILAGVQPCNSKDADKFVIEIS